MRLLKEELVDEKFYEHGAGRPLKERRLAHGRLDIVFSKMIKYRPEGESLPYLDIGITDGYLLNKALKSGLFKVYGVDIANRTIERVDQLLKSATLKKGSITKIPSQSNFFQLVTACELFEHMRGENINIALRETNRVLKQGGVLIATTPFKEDVMGTKSDKFIPNFFAITGVKG